MTCLGSWGCGARRATGLGVAESVRSGPTVLLAKQTGFGRTEMIKGWASVIIPTSLAGVEIAGSVKFINSCSSSVPCGGGDAVWVRGECACPVCWEDGSHSVSRVWRDAWCRGVGFVYFPSRCRPHVPEISDFFALAYGNIQ